MRQVDVIKLQSSYSDILTLILEVMVEKKVRRQYFKNITVMMFSKTLIIIVCSSNKNTKNHNMKFCFYCPYNLLCVFTARNLHRRCTLDQFEVWNSVAYVPVLRPLPSTWRALMIRDHFLWNW